MKVKMEKKDKPTHILLAEIILTSTGILGALLVALNIDEMSKYGYLLFFVSSTLAILVSAWARLWSFLAVNSAFVIINIIGIIRWFKLL